MKEYRTKPGWAAFIYVLGAVMLIGALLLIVAPIVPQFHFGHQKNNWIFPVLGTCLFALMSAAILSTLFGYIRLGDGSIEIRQLFTSKTFAFNEIKGYRIVKRNSGDTGVNATNYVIVPFDGNPVTISINYLKDGHEVRNWLLNNYPDLDEVSKKESLHAILQDERYGTTEEERAARLKTAKVVNGVLVGVSIVLCILLVALRQYFTLVFPLVVASPFYLLLIMRFFNGLIQLHARNDQAAPSGLFSLLIVLIAPCLIAFANFDVYEYTNIPIYVIPAFVLALLLVVLGWQLLPPVGNKRIGIILSLVAGCIAWAYGSVIAVNCGYDTSVPEQHRAQVYDKRVSRGSKSTSYYLSVTPWLTGAAEEISVGRSMYDDVALGDSITIYLQKGYLHMPWN